MIDLPKVLPGTRHPVSGFVKDPSFVIFPKRSYQGHLEIIERLEQESDDNFKERVQVLQEFRRHHGRGPRGRGGFPGFPADAFPEFGSAPDDEFGRGPWGPRGGRPTPPASQDPHEHHGPHGHGGHGPQED